MRQTQALEWIMGWHPVFAVLETRPEEVMEICLERGRSDSRAQLLQEKAKERGITVLKVKREALESLVNSSHHQGVALKARVRLSLTEEDLLERLDNNRGPVLLLLLEEVQDPHNLGACWRSAEAFGVEAIVTTTHHTAKETVTVKKIAAGAAETLPLVVVKNMVRFLKALQQLGFWIVGTAGEAVETIDSFVFPARCALLMGKEGEGLRRLSRETCDYMVSIPLAGKLRSLNLSVATGVCLFQAQKRGR